MKSERQIKRLAREIWFEPDAAVDQRVLARVEAVLQRSTKDKTAALLQRPLRWRMIMKSPIAKLSTAAVIIACVALTIPFMDKTTAPAYAFEQTLEAMQNLRTMYMVCKDWNNEEFEIWIKLDPNTGIPEYCRAYWPRAKVLNISRPDTSYQYNEPSNVVQTNSGKLYSIGVAPAKIFEQLLRASQEEPNSVVISYERQPNGKNLIVVVTRGYKGYDESYKAYIDPETKLPVRMKGFENNQLGAVFKDIDQIKYNVDLPEGIFDFKIPQGARIIDHDRLSALLNDPQYGISTEGMTEQQAAETIATRYWTAMITMDETAARKVAPASSLIADGSLAKLVEVGTLYIQPGCGIGKLIPCRLRYKDGSLKEWKVIIKTRNIAGRPSCVIAGYFASPVEIEPAK